MRSLGNHSHPLPLPVPLLSASARDQKDSSWRGAPGTLLQQVPETSSQDVVSSTDTHATSTARTRLVHVPPVTRRLDTKGGQGGVTALRARSGPQLRGAPERVHRGGEAGCVCGTQDDHSQTSASGPRRPPPGPRGPPSRGRQTLPPPSWGSSCPSSVRLSSSGAEVSPTTRACGQRVAKDSCSRNCLQLGRGQPPAFFKAVSSSTN